MAQLKLRNPFDEATSRPAQPPAGGRAGEPDGPETANGQAPPPTVRLSVDLERPLHRRLRRWALDRDQTASDVIRELLTSGLDAAGY